VYGSTVPGMLIAEKDGARIEAGAASRGDEHRCPVCVSYVRLHRGHKVVAHFKHVASSTCPLSYESQRHMEAKRLLRAGFESAGYSVKLEQPHSGGQRRVDVEVTLAGKRGPVRVAVEVQDSPIDVDKMKHRTKLDRRAGYLTTLWVFTENRLPAAFDNNGSAEARVPDELQWVSRRYQQGIPLLDTRTGQLVTVTLGPVVRDGSEWYGAGGEQCASNARTLRSTYALVADAAEFRLRCLLDPYSVHQAWFAPRAGPNPVRLPPR